MSALDDLLATERDEVIAVDDPDAKYIAWLRAINLAAVEKGEWQGVPMPLADLDLVIQRRHPLKQQLEAMAGTDERERRRRLLRDDAECEAAEAAGEPVARLGKIHRMFTARNHMNLIYWHGDPPRLRLMKTPLTPAEERLKLTIGVLGASAAWDIEAEFTAMQKLRAIISRTAWRHYVTTGSFLETSPRSHVTYLFRRLRPTVALRPNKDECIVPIAALCLHPIGWYAESFAGVMCPTDDVIAHVILMRGDEHRFWRMANQHDPNASVAGL